MNIYCDESGYTGGDLLMKEQPYFVYSAVCFTEKELDEIKKQIYSNYNIQNEEIKGKLIVKNTIGQNLILTIFKKYSKNARIVFHDKKYVLAAKIVEYGIEPYLSTNSHFYESKLHEFIASGLYSSFLLKDATAEKLFNDFVLILRGKINLDQSILVTYQKDNPLIEWFLDIITTNPNLILEEIQDNEGNIDKWVLDLTMTSLLGLLTEWSKNGDELTVTCDNSKVFVDNEVFEGLNSIGRQSKISSVLGTRIGFKLTENIKIEDSKQNIGLQIADLFSSTIYYCLNNQEKSFSKSILKIIMKNSVCRPASFCVTPPLISNNKEFLKKKDFFFEFMKLIYLKVKMKQIKPPTHNNKHVKKRGDE